MIRFTPLLTQPMMVSIFLCLTVLMLPLSSSGKSVFFALSVISILSYQPMRSAIYHRLMQPWCISSLLLFSLAIGASLWSPASLSDRLFVIEKYSKLLYLPLLAVGFSQGRTRYWALHAFLLAMLMTSLLATVKFHGGLTWLNINPDQVFRNHIMTGFMLAFASYLALIFCFQHQNKLVKLGYLILTSAFTYHVLFINGGRMAYVIYLIMMLLLVWQHFSFRQAIAGVVIVISIFLTCYWASPLMQLRLHSLLTERYQQSSSLGMRLQFQSFAYRLFKQHPIIGNGSASYTYYFKTLDPVPVWGHRLWEPHSQYWLVASEFGSLGLVLLCWFFYSLYQACQQLSPMYRMIANGMLIPFYIGSLSDSLLFYSGSGYFLLLIVAICLSESLRDTNN